MVKRYKPLLDKVYYHVVSRTAQLKYWLQDEPEVRAYWLKLVKFYSNVFYVDVLSYTLLSNHFHLVLCVRRPSFDAVDVRARHELAQSIVKNPRSLQPELEERYYETLCDLSKFMAVIKQRTSVFYNRRNKTKGHFWGGPFKSKVIDSEHYLLNALTYVELNSVRARLVEKPEDYSMSSLAEIKAEIEQRISDPTPRVGCLRKLPDFRRGKAYIELINHINDCLSKKGVSHSTAMKQFIGKLVDENGVEQILITIKDRVFQDWRQERFSETLKRRCSNKEAFS